MEKQYSGMSGYLFLFLELIVLVFIVFGFMRGMVVPSVLMIPVFILLAIGFTVVEPNQSCVMILFGAYKGTIKTNGFRLSYANILLCMQFIHITQMVDRKQTLICYMKYQPF